MITKLFEYERATDPSYEYENIHRKLNDMFTNFRETIPYLKNIWFTFKYSDVTFEFNIIWFYSYKTTKLISSPTECNRVLYKFTKNRDKLIIQNNIINERMPSIDFKDFLDEVQHRCLNLKNYMNYKSFPILKKIMENSLLILDYDKFLKEYEEELEESHSLELYKLIDDFYILLQYANIEKRKELEKYLAHKYEYILNTTKYNL